MRGFARRGAQNTLGGGLGAVQDVMPFQLWTVQWHWHLGYGWQVKSTVQQLQWLAAAEVVSVE